MNSSKTGALRGLRLQATATVDSPTEPRVAVLYLPAAARDRLVVRDRLARAGASVSLATDLGEAIRMLTARRYGLVVVDLAGETPATAAIRVLRAQSSAIPVIGVMNPADPAAAADAIGAGATDLLPWPFDDRDIQGIVTLARDKAAVESSETDAAWLVADEKLYAHSPAMRLVDEAINAASSRKAGILLVGEPASGRTVVARARHLLDDEYVNRPFVAVDCGLAAAGDVERRLFGAVDRSETQASSAEAVGRPGALIAAQGGALFLKNLTEAPARVQARLAAVLRDREVLSSEVNEIIPLDVRVIAAAGPDIESAVVDGRLRRDLFERLTHFRIEVPPFHRRREDLPFLAALFLRRACDAGRVGPKRFSRAALAILGALPWRGNGREMAATIGAIVRSARHPVIQIEDVLEQTSLDNAAERPSDTLTLKDARARFEREYISRALIRHHGRVGEAARTLGIQRTNLYRKVRQLKVSKTLLSTQR